MMRRKRLDFATTYLDYRSCDPLFLSRVSNKVELVIGIPGQSAFIGNGVIQAGGG
jgi:hypothetical protein